MEWVRLGDIATTITKGTTPTSVGYRFQDNGINFVKVESITENGIFVSEKFAHINEECNEKLARSQLQENDLLFSIAGAIGRTAIVNKNILPANTNQALAIIRIPEDVINYSFLMYVLRSPLILRQYDKLKQGVAQINLSLQNVKDFRIPKISLKEQEKIAEVLDKVNKLIDGRKHQLDKLDELVKSRFVEMFGDINLNNKGWTKQPLGELCTIVRGGSPRPIDKFLGGDIPWIKIGDATEGDNVYLYATKEHIIEEGVSKSRLVKAGSLIFANCGVSLGFARIITFDGCIHDGWLAMEDIDSRLDKIFLLQALNQMTQHFREIAPAGTQPNLNTSIMKAYKQIIPPMQLQKEYIDFVAQVDKSKLAVQKSLEQLEILKKSLMQAYFG